MCGMNPRRWQERRHRRRSAAVIALDQEVSPPCGQPEPQKTCGSIMGGHEHAAGNTQPERGCGRVRPMHAHAQPISKSAALKRAIRKGLASVACIFIEGSWCSLVGSIVPRVRRRDAALVAEELHRDGQDGSRHPPDRRRRPAPGPSASRTIAGRPRSF